MKAKVVGGVLVAALCVGHVGLASGESKQSGFDLREFCGFKFGSPHEDPSNTNQFVVVKLKEPFRLFKNAELCYTSENELYSIHLKLQDRPVVCHGILLSRLSRGVTFDVTAEAIQEEHLDIVEWAEGEYGVKFDRTKTLGRPAHYIFTNDFIRLSSFRENLFGTSELNFSVTDNALWTKKLAAEKKAKEEKDRIERELALRKNEFGRNKAEQAAYEKTVNIKTFLGFVFGETFTNQPIVFDAKTCERIKKGQRGVCPKGKLNKPFFQIDNATLFLGRATNDLATVWLRKFYSEVPPQERDRLSQQAKYERPGLYERQKEIAEWFAKEYQIVLVEDKIWRTFTFQNDYTRIEVKRVPYNDSIEVFVSGNMTPPKPAPESEIEIPASALGTFNSIL